MSQEFLRLSPASRLLLPSGRFSFPWLVLTAVALALSCGQGTTLASGGKVKLKTDNGPDGLYYNALSNLAARYVALYEDADIQVPPGVQGEALICGARVRELDQSRITPGVDDYVLGCDLRLEDPNASRYADLTPRGLIALADANSLRSCSTTGAARTRTFGGGAGVPDPRSRFFITLPQPKNNDPQEGVDFCGILLDRSSIFANSARTQSYTAAGGVHRSIRFNHFVEAIAFEPKAIDLDFRATGSARFPGDRGIPAFFARRRCDATSPGCLVDASDATGNDRSDDRMSVHLVIDNNTLQPRSLDMGLEADPFEINPKLRRREVLRLFRPIGGGPAVMNPVTLPSGRSILHLELPRAFRRKLLGALPTHIPFFARLQDPNDVNEVLARERQGLGLRPHAGYYDDDSHSGGFFFTQSPVVTGDALLVRFDAIDLPEPGNTLVVSGIEVVGGEFGASGLVGLDAVQLRREDAVLARNPDLSPQGLYRTRGTVGDPGNADGVPVGVPVTTVLVDFTDYVATPSVPGLAENLFGLAFLNPGDTVPAPGVIAIGSSGGGEGFIGNSSTLYSRTLPVVGFPDDDLEIRLDVDGALSTRAGGQRRTKRLDPLPPWRIPGVYQVMEENGRIVK